MASTTEKLTNINEDNLALTFVEDLIDNDNLCCYFSHMCNIGLRFENIFHLEKAKALIDQTRIFIIKLCNTIQFTIGILPNEYSTFHGDPYTVNGYVDYIMFDQTLINGCFGSESGESIERFLFGSVIDGFGQKNNGKYVIQYLILSDGRVSDVIDENWIKSFIDNALNSRNIRNMKHLCLYHLTI
ncbi:hypothetical protein I4U23_024249 [Adineta vaga]|nr:hypothetical protein I4U23_024249 [Adineta vaga]